MCEKNNENGSRCDRLWRSAAVAAAAERETKHVTFTRLEAPRAEEDTVRPRGHRADSDDLNKSRYQDIPCEKVGKYI